MYGEVTSLLHNYLPDAQGILAYEIRCSYSNYLGAENSHSSSPLTCFLIITITTKFLCLISCPSSLGMASIPVT